MYSVNEEDESFKEAVAALMAAREAIGKPITLEQARKLVHQLIGDTPENDV